MARSTIRITNDLLAKVLEENVPWPPGTRLTPLYGGEVDFVIEGPDVPDVPEVTPSFASVMYDAGRVATKFDHWLT